MESSSNSLWGDTPYLRSPLYDWTWIILSPVWAIGLGWIMTQWLFQETITLFDTSATGAYFFYMALTQAHLFITGFRTHANTQLFQHYYWRFTLVPVLAFFAALTDPWIFAGMFVLMVFWDVYHSSLQVFGLTRIYDRKAGNDPSIGRVPDYLLCLLMYAGPVLGGALLLSHLQAFHEFGNASDLDVLGILFSPQVLAGIPEQVNGYAVELRTAVLAFTLVIAIVYVFFLVKQTKAGYRLPFPKAVMLTTTATACVFAWGFNSFAMGYLIANIFHAVQYFALVWVLEDRSVRKVINLAMWPRLLLFISVPFGLGLLSVSLDSTAARAFLMVCALMHFWWDGFIWSVRTDDGIPLKGGFSSG